MLISFIDDVKLKLLAKGIPEHQIAFVHDAKTDKQRKELFDRVNAGEVRFVLGSSQKMGTGVNMQQRLKAAHHLDAPWRPAEIEQREGRILRQGNLNDEVEIYRYVTEGSFDVYSWQTLESKAKFIAQLLHDPDNPPRSMADIDEAVLGYAEMKAIATGNPVIIEQIELDTESKQLKLLQRAHINAQNDMDRQMRSIESDIERRQTELARWQKIQADVPPSLETFQITLDDQDFRGQEGKKAAGEFFGQLYAAHEGLEKRTTIGQINGYTLRIQGRGYGHSPKLEVEMAPGFWEPIKVTDDMTRTMTRLMNEVNQMPNQAVDHCHQGLEKLTQERDSLANQLNQPFEQAEQLMQAEDRLREVELQLSEWRKEEAAAVLAAEAILDDPQTATVGNNEQMVTA